MMTNHTVVIGPNRDETLAVPRHCTEKRATRITMASGKTRALNAGVTTLNRRQYGQGGGNQSRAVEHGCADHAKNERKGRAATEGPKNQRGQ